MNVKFIQGKILYDGTQLTPHWIYNKFDIAGDCIVSFIGGCNIKFNNIVDLEDLKENRKIYSEEMLHFIGEFFDFNLRETILLQRLFISIIKDELFNKTKDSSIRRIGDDIYVDRKKFSISIATRSEVSSLLHIGLNIEIKNTPVETSGLSDYKIEPKNFAKLLLRKFEEEIESINIAKVKVRAVR